MPPFRFPVLWLPSTPFAPPSLLALSAPSSTRANSASAVRSRESAPDFARSDFGTDPNLLSDDPEVPCSKRGDLRGGDPCLLSCLGNGAAVPCLTRFRGRVDKLDGDILALARSAPGAISIPSPSSPAATGRHLFIIPIRADRWR